MFEHDGPTVACPTCNGPLSGEAEQWICRVGHRFTFSELASDQADAVVRTLWYASRALEDRAISSEYVASDYDQAGLSPQADRLRAQRALDLSMVDKLHDILRFVDSAHSGPGEGSQTMSNNEQPSQGSHE